MTETTYAAYIVTAEATALGDPEIIVMTVDEGMGADPLISYPLTPDADPAVVLHAAGWFITGEAAETAEYGYSIVDVTPANWSAIISAATFAREAAEAERARCETAWRTLIRDAMNDDESAIEIAKAAKISRARAYQVRDNRR